MSLTQMSIDDIKKQYVEQKAWGLTMNLDLIDCSPIVIRSQELVKEYIVRLCDLIDMKRYGEPLIENFGTEEREGITFVQLIETSNIAGHL